MLSVSNPALNMLLIVVIYGNGIAPNEIVEPGSKIPPALFLL
jgi:hypothetical protein